MNAASEMITKIKTFFAKLVCAYRNHPGKREQDRHTSAFYPNNDYVEYFCPCCNEIIATHEQKCETQHNHTEQSH